MAEEVGPAELGACNHCPSFAQTHLSVPDALTPVHLIPYFLNTCLSCAACQDPWAHCDSLSFQCIPTNPCTTHIPNPPFCTDPHNPYGPGVPHRYHMCPQPIHAPGYAAIPMHTLTPACAIHSPYTHSKPYDPAHAPMLTPFMLIPTYHKPHRC